MCKSLTGSETRQLLVSHVLVCFLPALCRLQGFHELLQPAGLLLLSLSCAVTLDWVWMLACLSRTDITYVCQCLILCSACTTHHIEAVLAFDHAVVGDRVHIYVGGGRPVCSVHMLVQISGRQ
jgi:hypothetical protein